MKKNFLVLALLFLVFETNSNRFVSDAALKPVEDEKLKPELILQSGHSKAVRAVVVSPDKRWALLKL